MPGRCYRNGKGGKIMSEYKTLKCNEAAAYAAKLSKPDVVSAYPITPSTTVPEQISEFVADGKMDAEFIPVESEHSAMSGCIGASASGSRAFTATASQGLALMSEMLYIAAGMRLPISMAIGNRALSAPINIWCDHQDMMAQRDTGWMQMYAENNQEAFDLIINSYKVAENEDVLLPAMTGFDAFILTHTVEPVEIYDEEKVDDFLGEYNPSHAYVDSEDPMTQGTLGTPEYYMEFRKETWDAMNNARDVFKDVFNEFEDEFGRSYDMVEKYRTEDAEIVFISMGSVTGTIKDAIDELRDEGVKAGLAKITVYRPFPIEEIKEIAKNAEAIAVAEKNVSFGSSGAVYQDVNRTIANVSSRPIALDFIIGLGGRDVRISTIKDIADITQDALDKGVENLEKEVHWIGLEY